MTALQRLAALLREEGGPLADAVVAPDGAMPEAPLGALAASGARLGRHADDYALLVETIHEGYLQHYGEGRVVRPQDPELALLAGDRLYALGLSRLAELGDLRGVAILADVISRCAQAHAEGDGDAAGAIWRQGIQELAHARGPAKTLPVDPG